MLVILNVIAKPQTSVVKVLENSLDSFAAKLPLLDGQLEPIRLVILLLFNIITFCLFKLEYLL